MPNWIRDSGRRLVKLETPHKKELELSLNIMEATPEDQHSHHGHQDNPNAFRSMRDCMHPPRMSAPSCIMPPTDSRGWDEPNKGEVGKTKSQPNVFNAKAGMYTLNEDIDMKAKVAPMTRRLEELELKKIHEVQVVAETLVQVKPCPICQSYEYLVEECPTIPAAREMFGDQENVIGQFKPNNNALYENTYNSNWRNHPNFSWKPRAPQVFTGERCQNLITLRSGKKVELPTPKPYVEKEEEEEETEKREEINGKKKDSSERKEDHDSIVNATLEKVLIKGDVMKKHTPPPFPQVLHVKKGIKNASEILEVLRQVKVNIPLLDMIKQVPTYVKFLKDLCTIKRGLNVNKKAFLTEQVSAIIQCKSPLKYKDPGCPTILVMIGGTVVEKALLDLGASVNLLPYSIYKQLGLGELKPTLITLSLADRSVKIPRGIIEDVLVQVDNFYYPLDFVVLDIYPIVKETNYVPIILGRPFLATSNAIINCRNGLMQLMFSNMTMELNIFYMSKKPITLEEEEGPKEVCIIDTLVEEHCNKKIQEKLNESLGDLEEGLLKPSNLLAALQGWRRREEILPLFNKEEAQEAAKEETLKLNLKPLPTELKYTYLEKNRKCPVVISSSLTTLRRSVYLKFSRDKPIRQPQRRLNPHVQEVVRAEVLKLLQAGIIYLISDSPWVSPTQVVPKKLGITVVQNEKGEEVATCLTSDQEKTTFTCPFGTYAYRRMPFGLCNAPATFQRCMLSIFSDMVERIMEVFMDDITIYGSTFEECLVNLEAVLNRCIEKDLVLNWEKCHFMELSWPKRRWKALCDLLCKQTLNEAQRNYTTQRKNYAKARLIRWILLLQEFNLQIRDKKGVENVKTPWYAHIANYLVTGEVPNQIIRKCVPEEEQQGILSHCHESACGGHFASQKTTMKVLQSGLVGHHFSKMPTPCVGAVIDAKGLGS
ncbi:Retrovirus-related Pol polyprotein from transposon 297 [Vitis vinifera]|uniref:Retrovirus-related Pol polyprotein from transposon 297 n=1 Tax=Vitis vinifera TaxID=29760 RepID=A0A438FL61_VITVI|nr:Retrovirus-related Pol polyprotein from transposon 297 [Vitis vinifera]